jgi:hypothetical protein
MKKNIQEVLNRGEKLDHVSQVSSNLVNESKKFKWGAKQVRIGWENKCVCVKGGLRSKRKVCVIPSVPLRLASAVVRQLLLFKGGGARPSLAFLSSSPFTQPSSRRRSFPSRQCSTSTDQLQPLAFSFFLSFTGSSSRSARRGALCLLTKESWMLCLMNFAFSIIPPPASFPLIIQIYDSFLPVFLRDSCVFCVCFSFGILVSQLSELQVDSTTNAFTTVMMDFIWVE